MRYRWDGACIYCGDGKSTLSNEHVIPLAIGGSFVIESASCATCARVTSRFELNVMRDLWGHMRIAYNLPTRHRSRRPSHLPLLTKRGEGPPPEIPAGDYPAMILFYKMVPPGILQDLAPDADLVSRWSIYTLNDKKRRDSFVRKYPHLKAIDYARNRPYDFGRLMAKIAYGYVVTKIDIGDIDPICLPYILGQKTNITYIVGDDEDDTYRVGLPYVSHQLSIEGDYDPTLERLLVIANVRLFSDADVPTYKVVVGQVCGHTKANRVIKKAGWEEV